MNDRFQLGVEQIAQAALPLMGETKDINGASQVCISFGFAGITAMFQFIA